MERMDFVRSVVRDVLLNMASPVDGNRAAAHLYGVSQLAALLAQQRGLDPELAAASGLLHDLYTCRTRIPRFHDQNGAEFMRPVLRDSGFFSAQEQRLILEAIFYHSNKQSLHTPYAEVLKDADVLQHFLTSPQAPVPKHFGRLLGLLRDLALPHSGLEWDEPTNSSISKPTRESLAAIAEGLASRQVEGIPENKDFQGICRYWPDKEIYSVLKGNWCASFVYHCCTEAGFFLPIRHPAVSMRFAGVGAWLQWAQLSENEFLHTGRDFLPQRGDIVVFDQLLTDNHHDHIGIVLSCCGKALTVAEGNVDNQNKSGIVSRSRDRNIAGFIRVPEDYRYEPGDMTFSLPGEK